MSTITDEERRRGLRRMKTAATGLLVAAACVYAVARRAEEAGAPGWVGFVRAAAEAGLVGGLADWFAVTALFRHPLGLPIPHTALVPTRKDALGRTLSDFVGANFLAEPVVRGRVRQAGIAARAGAWLAQPHNARRVATELAVAVRGALTVLRDEDVQELLERTIVAPLAALPVGPPLGRLLERIVKDGTHGPLVDLAAREARRWLLANRQTVMRVVMRQAPPWSPRIVDEAVAGRVYTELVRFVREVEEDPRHALRATVDRFLSRVAHDLQHDPDTMARADALEERLLAREDVRAAIAAIWSSARRVLMEAVDDPGSDLRQRAEAALVSLGRRLVEDPGLQDKADRWIEDAVAHVATTYRDELTKVITETVERWDARETTHKIELAVGRDLQFIRVNGTVVGALAGVAIHTVSLAVF